MQRVLVMSSYVTHGAVGLQATLPPLQRPGLDIIALPTILLSSHPGYARFAGAPVAPELLDAMTAALDANGWLAGVGAILTGYLPSAEHVAWARRTVDRVRTLNAKVGYVCDPVLGDDPGGLYVSLAAAEAVRDDLVPVAGIITPNRFELSWLSGIDVTDPKSAVAAARALGCTRTAATSIPDADETLANLLITPSVIWKCSVTQMPDVPHGTGDLFAGLLLASLLDADPDDAALAHATGGVAYALNCGGGAQDLALSGLRWTADAFVPADVVAWQT